MFEVMLFDRWSVPVSAPVWPCYRGLPGVRLSSLRRAPRLLFGSGKKEWAGEELYMGIFSFPHRKSTQRVVSQIGVTP